MTLIWFFHWIVNSIFRHKQPSDQLSMSVFGVRDVLLETEFNFILFVCSSFGLDLLSLLRFHFRLFVIIVNRGRGREGWGGRIWQYTFFFLFFFFIKEKMHELKESYWYCWRSIGTCARPFAQSSRTNLFKNVPELSLCTERMMGMLTTGMRMIMKMTSSACVDWSRLTAWVSNRSSMLKETGWLTLLEDILGATGNIFHF